MKPGDLVLVKDTKSTRYINIQGKVGVVQKIIERPDFNDIYNIDIDRQLSDTYDLRVYSFFEYEIQVISKEEYEAALVLNS